MGRPGLTRHRKFKRLARDLDASQVGFGELLARGALELLWDGAYEAGDAFLGDQDDVEALASWRGERGLLATALASAGGEHHAGFTEEGGSTWWPDGKPGAYRVHDLWDHAPAYVQRRAEREAERKQKGESIASLRAEAGRKGGIASGRARRDREANGSRRPSRASVEEANGATPAPAQAHAPTPTPARLQVAGGDVQLGPLGAALRAGIEAGLGHGLIPPKTQEEADELEVLVQACGGVEKARMFIAATCRQRDTDPRAVAWLVSVLQPTFGERRAAQ